MSSLSSSCSRPRPSRAPTELRVRARRPTARTRRAPRHARRPRCCRVPTRRRQPKWWLSCRRRRCPGTGSNCPRALGAGSPRLRAVLEGLLEDRLLDEPETLHFALQPRPRPASRSGWRSATAPGCAAPAGARSRRPAGRRASFPNSRPRATPALYALGEPEDAPLVLRRQRGRAAPAADRRRAGAAAFAARGHAAAWPNPPWRRMAEQVLQHAARCCSSAPQRWLQAAARPLGPGAVRIRQLRPRPRLQEARRRLGRRAARAAVAAGALGRACCWWLVQPGRPERLGLEGARRPWTPSATPCRSMLTQTFPQGQRGGRCAGADGARSRRAAPGHRRRLGPRPRSHAGRARAQPLPPGRTAGGARIHRRRAARARPGAADRTKCAAAAASPARARATPPTLQGDVLVVQPEDAADEAAAAWPRALGRPGAAREDAGWRRRGPGRCWPCSGGSRIAPGAGHAAHAPTRSTARWTPSCSGCAALQAQAQALQAQPKPEP